MCFHHYFGSFQFLICLTSFLHACAVSYVIIFLLLCLFSFCAYLVPSDLFSLVLCSLFLRLSSFMRISTFLCVCPFSYALIQLLSFLCHFSLTLVLLWAPLWERFLVCVLVFFALLYFYYAFVFFLVCLSVSYVFVFFLMCL